MEVRHGEKGAFSNPMTGSQYFSGSVGLGSGKVVSIEGKQRTECFGHISKWLLFLCPCWKYEGIFLQSSP